MQRLVAEWRKLWSKEDGTTSVDAPFGLVTLATSGSEGGQSMGTMHWAQTSSYGRMSNPALPNTFLAHAYDLDDPYTNISCYHKVGCHDNSPVPPGGWGYGCDGYCASVKTTNFYMGPIHPRPKLPVGKRLAKAAMVVAYGAKAYSNGPTISGCSVDEDAKVIRITFNKTLLQEGGAMDSILVQPYYQGNVQNYGRVGSKMEVLLNASLFCMQLGGGGCLDDGTGKSFNASWKDSVIWQAVNIAPGKDGSELMLDLSTVNGTVYAIRYADNGNCCSERPPTSDPCPVASCPIIGSISKLPANPFIAKIENNKCKCMVPQVCNQ
jgi:sialate O-acetylesterase